MKKGEVYQYHVEIQGWKDNGSVLMQFFKLHIASFYKNVQKALDEILTELLDAQKRFMEFDEHGKIKMHDETTPVFKEGFKLADYEKAYMEIMDQECPEVEKPIEDVVEEKLNNGTMKALKD